MSLTVDLTRIVLPEAVAPPIAQPREYLVLGNLDLGPKGVKELRQYIDDSHLPLSLIDEVTIGKGSPFDGVGGPLSQTYVLKARPNFSERELIIPNRLAIAPMEGWDGNIDGSISEEVRERWLSFARSGAGLLWGCEAVAAGGKNHRTDGRANPNQLVLSDATFEGFKKLRKEMDDEFRKYFPHSKLRPIVGLQLTHSGRFASPIEHNKRAPLTAYNHPLLDKGNEKVLSDAEIDQLIEDFIYSAKLAWKAGFDFVDIKHCHGYLGHELLSAFDRKDSKYGGSFENRTRFLRRVVEGIRREAPGLRIGVRLSAYDFVPFVRNEHQHDFGQPMPFGTNYRYAFGGDGSGQGIDLTEPLRFLDLLDSLGVDMLCTTAGSPYYNSHIQRPTDIAPSDAYRTPIDPLAAMALQIEITSWLKKLKPNIFTLGSAYTYGQGFIGNFAEASVKEGKADAVCYGRMAIPYPQTANDILTGNWMKKFDPSAIDPQSIDYKYYIESSRAVCRLAGICTTFPRNGHKSDCPYKNSQESTFFDRGGTTIYKQLRSAGKIRTRWKSETS